MTAYEGSRTVYSSVVVSVLESILQQLNGIEGLLRKATLMQVQLPTAWCAINKSVPAEDVDVLLWRYDNHRVVVGRRIGDKFVRSMTQGEFEVAPLYWMPVPPDPPIPVRW